LRVERAVLRVDGMRRGRKQDRWAGDDVEFEGTLLRRIALGVGAAVLAVSLGGLTSGASRHPVAPAYDSAVPVQVSFVPLQAQTAPIVCDLPPLPAPVTAPVSARTTPGGTTVSFTVLPVTQVQLDARGAPVLVRTNTGAAPDCTTDQWYTLAASSTKPEPAPLAMINQVMNGIAPSDQWSPGVWHELAR
jgi:hypothetical protein